MSVEGIIGLNIPDIIKVIGSFNAGYGFLSNLQKLLPNRSAKSLNKLINVKFDNDQYIQCLFEGGLEYGKFNGFCSIRSNNEVSLGITPKAQIPEGRVFLQGEFKEGVICGQGKLYNLFGDLLFDGFLVSGLQEGIAKVCAEAPIYKQSFSRGLYIGNLSERKPHGKGVMCVPINLLFTNYYLDAFTISMASEYSSRYDVHFEFENYLLRNLQGFPMNSNVIGTNDPYDSVLLRNAMSVRELVEETCNVVIPKKFYPIYVGHFKNGMFHGKGLLNTGDFDAAYAGHFEQSVFKRAEDISLETIGNIFK